MAAGRLYDMNHLRRPIWKYHCEWTDSNPVPKSGRWIKLDDNPTTAAVAAAWQHLYQIRTNGNILKYDALLNFDQTPSATWLLIDHWHESVAIAATDNDLYQLHRTGRIWKWNGTPSSWQLIHDFSNCTASIHAASGFLYQTHVNGQVWMYTGTPHVWTCVSATPAVVDSIVMSGKCFFMLTRGGDIKRDAYCGKAPPPANQKLYDVESDKQTKMIAASGNALYALQNNGVICKAVVSLGPQVHEKTIWHLWCTLGTAKFITVAPIRADGWGEHHLFAVDRDGSVRMHVGGRWHNIGESGDYSVVVATSHCLYRV
ncbi:hypothetical protein BV898_19668 [Hypsibius exemplaris]|uniref:Uncharacterized protein n=1 Tax=Hypsibius exemplaris TaxID=2072580 RepID=A0A9X6NJN4_HYPEX|nr:hypothetical protein BV898_19668 [Hypsibius exemplaris]